jgi:hypothetical protein
MLEDRAEYEVISTNSQGSLCTGKYPPPPPKYQRISADSFQGKVRKKEDKKGKMLIKKGKEKRLQEKGNKIE